MDTFFFILLYVALFFTVYFYLIQRLPSINGMNTFGYLRYAVDLRSLRYVLDLWYVLSLCFHQVMFL